MKTIKLFAYALLVISMSLASCSTDGEDGMDGAPGPQGIAGQDGIDGQDGNANVTSILLENVSVVNGINDYDIPEITQEIYDHGYILGYVTVNGNDYWESMPITSGGEVILELDRYSVGSLQIRTTFSQGNLNMRFILVEGNPSGGRSTRFLEDFKSELLKDGVDINNYYAVKNYFDL